MLSLQKSTSNRTDLGYDFSSPSITSTSATAFVLPANNIETKNNDVNNELASENIARTLRPSMCTNKPIPENIAQIKFVITQPSLK